MGPCSWIIARFWFTREKVVFQSFCLHEWVITLRFGGIHTWLCKRSFLQTKNVYISSNNRWHRWYYIFEAYFDKIVFWKFKYFEITVYPTLVSEVNILTPPRLWGPRSGRRKVVSNPCRPLWHDSCFYHQSVFSASSSQKLCQMCPNYWATSINQEQPRFLTTKWI